MQDTEKRLSNAIQELESTRKDLREAREGANATAAALQDEREALSTSRARTEELHKLGVDMERELTAMLKGGLFLLYCSSFSGRWSSMVDLVGRGGVGSAG